MPPMYRRAWLCSVLISSFVLPATAQIREYDPNAVPKTPQAAAPPQQDGSQQSSLADIARNMREKKRKTVKVGPEEAKEIFKAVDELSQFASNDSGLPLHTAVKRRLVGQSEVEKLTREQKDSEEEKAERQRGLLAMKKFGLLPREFDTEGFAAELMGESVAGFYDPKTKMVSLLNWVDLEEQKSVLAHELTHALQDQNYDLQRWHKQHRVKATDGYKSLVGNDTDEGESSTAARSVTEGQAMVVMLDYLLTPLGTDLAHQPGLMDAIQEKVSYGVEGPVLHRAPLAIREGMSFPYKEGLNFEIALLANGKAAAFEGALQHPPHLTYEVLHPQAYMKHEKIVPVRIPDLKPVLGESARIQDAGVIGELDTRVFIRQYASNWLAAQLAKAWRGASYVTVARSAEGTPASTKDIAMLYVSRWQSDEAAQKYAEFYVDATAKRYTTATRTADWKPTAGKSGQAISSTELMTEEGPVIVEVWPGSMVVVTESFEPEAAIKVREAVLGKGAAAPLKMSMNDVTLRLADMPELGPLRNAVQQNALRAIQETVEQLKQTSER